MFTADDGWVWTFAAVDHVAGQAPQGAMPVAAMSVTTGLSELRQLDALVETLVGAGELLVRSRNVARQLSGRVHESAMQYHRGVPVYGGGITRQLAGGATVSIFGTIHQGIDIDITPGAFRHGGQDGAPESVGGAALVSGPLPSLTIFPLPGRSYALTWRSPNGELPDGSPIVTVDIVAHEIDARRHAFLGNRYADRGPATPVQGRPTAMATLSLVGVPYPAIGQNTRQYGGRSMPVTDQQ